MTDAFLLRHFDEPYTDESFAEMLQQAGGCLGLYRVEWCGSLLSQDGHRLFCAFKTPDLESLRQSLRQAGETTFSPWAGSVHDAPSPSAPPAEEANVVVARRFDAPVALDDIQAIEDAGAHCLEMRGVEFARTYFSHDRRLMVCLYRAPDAEAVREAQRAAGMPFDAVWAFRRKN